MRIRSPKDFCSGLFFIAVAAGFIGLSHQYGTGTMHRMGPGLFPTLVGVLLVGLGLIIALRAFAIDDMAPRAPRTIDDDALLVVDSGRRHAACAHVLQVADHRSRL